MRLASARRSTSKMASEGASGEAPGQSLTAAVLTSADTKCGLNMDNLSKPELLTLLSIMEGELEARDLVIEALRAQRKEVFLQERYGHFQLRDPFLALQRDMQCSVSGDKDTRVPGSSPMAVLQAVMSHCRKMQERMSAQLAAAETRHKRLEMEKLQLQSLEQEHRKLTAQLKDERDKNKHIVMMLVRECKQLATRVVEESQRFDELQTRYDEETRGSGRLQEELENEKQKSQQMEATMEKQLSEFDTEREQLRAKLSREETENQNLRQQIETLRTGQSDSKEAKANEPSSKMEISKVETASVSVATDPVPSRTISCQTDSEVEAPKKGPLSIPVKPSPANYVGLSLPKTRALSSENGSESAQHASGIPTGVSPRVQAARYKFQEQDQNQNGSQSSPPARDLSPTNRDTNFAAKQQARHTVTQVLSRFTSPPSSTPLRPGLPHSASESGPFPGRLSHPIGMKSPTVARIDRGNPPPIPPKKPGLSQTPAPSVKAGEGGRGGLKITPQLPPKPALDLVPPLAASQTKTAAAACAPPPPSSPDCVSLLAAASGCCPPLAPGSGGAWSGALDSDLLKLPAALQEHATLMSMSMLLNPRQKLQKLQPSDCDPAQNLPSTNQNTLLDCDPTRNVLSANHSAPLACGSAHNVLSANHSVRSDCEPAVPVVCANHRTPLDYESAHNLLSSNRSAPSDCEHTHNRLSSNHSDPLDTEPTHCIFSSNHNALVDCEPAHNALSANHSAPLGCEPARNLRSSDQSALSDCERDHNVLSTNHIAPLDCEPGRYLSSSNHNAPLFGDRDSIENLRISALFAAAQNGQTDFVEELLSVVSADVTDLNGLTPLHFAAAQGHSSSVSALLSSRAQVDAVSSGGVSALTLASEAGQTHCVRLLLEAGADRNVSTTDGCSALHAAVRSGNLELLRLLLYHTNDPRVTPDLQSVPRVNLDPTASPTVESMTLNISAELLNQTNTEGWTAAHLAAAHGFKECLEELCSHPEQNLNIRDKWDRTIHDLATDDCKDLLENLNSYRVGVVLPCSAAPDDSALVASSIPPLDHLDLGSVVIDRSTAWSQLWPKVVHIFMDYVRSLCECPELDQDRNQDQDRPLGLSHRSIKSICIGDREWSVGEEVSFCPWDLVRKLPSPSVRVRLKGLSESCLDEVALFSLIPLSTLNNYVRLVEQYGNLMLHGVEGSLQENIAAVVAHCIKKKQEVLGFHCEVFRVQVDSSLTREQLLDSFIQAGLLAPAGSEGGARVVVTVEHLERALSLCALMGDICHSLDHRGPQHTVHTSSGPHWLVEGGYVITTLSKPRLQGSELRLQQHLRWVSLRWDQEPESGLLYRTLRARLQTAVWSNDSSLHRSALWVTRFWQRLNSCLCRLGTTEALIGPELFMTCPLSSAEDTVRFLCALWNSVVVPRIEQAIVSRVSPRRSPLSPHSPSSSSSSPEPTEGQTPGQRALVKAALSIVLNRAVLQDCPLSRSEMDKFLPDFTGSSFPLSALSPDPRPVPRSESGPGSGPGSKPGSMPARLWRRREHRLRRSNTSPRKRAVSGSGLSGAGGSFREASQSTSDVRFLSGDQLHREGMGLCVFSDEETDLIRELQTMCSSKSEPDISKISQTKEMFPSESSRQQQQQQRNKTPPVSPSIPRSNSRLPLPTTRVSHHHHPTRPSTTNTTAITTTTTNTTTPDDNQHFINNNHLQNQSRRSSGDDVWILHENYITHNPSLLPR
ncbi:cortactin-binding protein 2 [Boleophthalmus pectinirostris]|uniref:cortactin-binding protein 2 n=1 Tax=Boleophthalmus pectinirostris TaxID=150288 RepID=UPI00242DA115|nr:cortactin-binding protein 2 [Boleophthalmus pectinirostris]